MTRENGLDEEIITEQASVSTSHSPGKLSQEPPQKADTQQRKEKEENTQVLPYYKLYSFADLTDFVLIGVGTIAAIGNGICMPLLTLLMGNLVNAFGQNSNIKQVVDEVSKVLFQTWSLYFNQLYFKSGLFIIDWLVTFSGVSEFCILSHRGWCCRISP